MAANIRVRKSLDAIQEQRDSEKEWWEKRRASIQQDFMKEIEEESKAAS